MKKNNPLIKTMPHLGEFAKAFLDKEHITQARVIKLTGWAKGTVSAMLRRRDWLAIDLLYFHKKTGHDMVQHLYPAAAEATVAVSEYHRVIEENKRLEKQLAETEEDLKIVTAERDVLIKVTKGK